MMTPPLSIWARPLLTPKVPKFEGSPLMLLGCDDSVARMGLSDPLATPFVALLLPMIVGFSEDIVVRTGEVM